MRAYFTAAMATFALANVIGCTLSPANPNETPSERAPEAKTAPKQNEPVKQDVPKEEAKKPPQDQPKPQPPDIEAQDETWRKKMEELLKGKTVGEQSKIVESQEYLDAAMKQKEQGDYQKAKQSVDRALELNPLNLEARKLKEQIDRILMKPGRPNIEDVRDTVTAQIKGQILEITNHIKNGSRLAASKEFESALEELKLAEVQLYAMPDQIPEKGTFLPAVRDQIKKIKESMEEEAKVQLEMKRRAIAEEQRASAEAEQKEMVKKMADMLDLAYMSFDQRKYDECIRLCDKILDVDPHYTVAMELKEDSQKTKVRRDYHDYVARKVAGWKEMTAGDNEARIPYQDIVNFPSKEKWREIERRAQESTIKAVSELDEPEQIVQIRKKLDSMKIEKVDYKGDKLSAILDYFRQFTGLNIIVDERVKAEFDVEKPVDFSIKDMTVRNALKYLLEQFGMDYIVTEEKLVKITKPQFAQGKPVLELYDIRDLVIKLNNFPGPKLELQGGEGTAGAPGISFSLEEPEAPKVSGDDLIDLIKKNIEPASWDMADAGYSVNQTPNHQLLVNHTPKAHRQIRDFLARLRSYTGLMVSITVRFLAAYDDSLLDVGVDLINRPPDANTYDIFGTAATDIEESTGQRGPGVVITEGGQPDFYDLRAQTFHTLLKVDPITAAANVPIVQDDTSGRTLNRGGLGMVYQWIGEHSLQAVLRAVEKHHKATIVQSPRVTVFNTQRAHILVISRLAYIKDYDVVAVGFLAAYDPIVGHLTHGVVLDVRPIISHDRKYVTVELRTDYAELQVMRTVTLTAGGALPLQLPWVVFQRAQCTVLVPDRGTLVVSGFRDINLHDSYSGIPFLSDIPIISFFFTRKAKLHEKRRLYILVTPEIIDMSEHEALMKD